MKATTIDRVIEIAVATGGARIEKCQPNAAIHQDLGVNGDDGEAFVDALYAEFGEWIVEWPWHRFIDFNEPPANIGPKIWKLLRLPNPAVAFPGFVEERLELGHIAAVIEKGQWFDP
jgi:hypothetical protein